MCSFVAVRGGAEEAPEWRCRGLCHPQLLRSSEGRRRVQPRGRRAHHLRLSSGACPAPSGTPSAQGRPPGPFSMQRLQAPRFLGVAGRAPSMSAFLSPRASLFAQESPNPSCPRKKHALPCAPRRPAFPSPPLTFRWVFLEVWCLPRAGGPHAGTSPPGEGVGRAFGDEGTSEPLVLKPPRWPHQL